MEPSARGFTLRTTHDWSDAVDLDHLEAVRAQARASAPTALHLVLEVLAYALDEAREGSTRTITVTIAPENGSLEVRDDGRGTDTRRDLQGRPVVKPIMGTRDLRFFDAPGRETVPDGLPRRGMSVVAALSRSLVHENRRRDGGWTACYVHGRPEGPLHEIAGDGTTGTVVRFVPDESVVARPVVDPDELRTMVAGVSTPATIVVR